MSEEKFIQYKDRLNVLDEDVRKAALKYAEEFLKEENSSKEEAIEKAIAKAEMEKRNL